MVTRRRFGMGLAGTLALGATAPAAGARQARAWPGELERQLDHIEAGLGGGMLGIGCIDTRSGRTADRRGNTLFPICSAYKALAAAAILARVDQGTERLDRRVYFDPDQVLSYSPGTKAHAGREGMTVAAICEAAVTLSDNTAGNLIFDALGGPEAVTHFLRGIGDPVTRLDRREPALNEATPGDPRDTTSPLAMAADLERLVLGTSLSPGSRGLLVDWLQAGQTGAARLRAGVPKGWPVGEKTGTGEQGSADDVGVIWPPGRAPVVLAVFITGATVPVELQSAAIAAVTNAIVGMWLASLPE